MTVTLKVRHSIPFKEKSASLKEYLVPTVESLMRQNTEIIKVVIRFKPANHRSGICFPDHINLIKKQKTGPLRHHTYPISYRRQEYGTLHLTRLIKTEANINEDKQFNENQYLKKIASTLSLLIKRYQVASLSDYYLGKKISLNGHSEIILKLDSLIEKAASTFCPVIIYGNTGTEKLSVASAIHYNSDIRHKPFYEVNCSTPSKEEFQHNLVQGFKKAHGGCIYLHAIDELSPAQQNLLTELLSTRTAPRHTDKPLQNPANIRLLISTTEPLEQLVKLKKFSYDLYEKFNFLTIEVPEISQRKEDIPLLLHSLVNKYRLFSEQKLSTEVNKVLSDYHWPNNYAEINQMLARLLTFSINNPIKLEDVKQLIPEVLVNQHPASYEENSPNVIKTLNFNLISCLQEKDYNSLKHLHRGLQKALTFLGEHYSEDITLTILSQQAFISPSHLSYLFKHNLSRTFKQVLSELRIEKAKQIISMNPLRLITETSLDVGFGDLSHFEKMFKRFTKMTPRQYKTIVKEQQYISN